MSLLAFLLLTAAADPAAAPRIEPKPAMAIDEVGMPLVKKGKAAAASGGRDCDDASIAISEQGVHDAGERAPSAGAPTGAAAPAPAPPSSSAAPPVTAASSSSGSSSTCPAPDAMAINEKGTAGSVKPKKASSAR